jgi:hypothetical protein
MSIHITTVDDDAFDRWNDNVARSEHGTPFHRFETLRVLAAETDTELHLLVGYKGEEPVGLFPVFEMSRPAVSAVFSPPPDLRIPALGPILLGVDGMKRGRRERRHLRFIERCLEWLDAEFSSVGRYMHCRTGARYTDLRPFWWNGFRVSPEFTYVVDIDRDESDLLSAFSRDARTNVRALDREDCTVEVGDIHAIEPITEQVRSRYAEQGHSYHITPAFVRDLYRSLPEGHVRPYVCTVDGEFAGGVLTLETQDTIYRWQGAADHDVDIPVSDVLDWWIISDARERGIERYDFVGASTQRLNRYKAKFDPELRAYHSVERGGPVMNLIASLYVRLR